MMCHVVEILDLNWHTYFSTAGQKGEGNENIPDPLKRIRLHRISDRDLLGSLPCWGTCHAVGCPWMFGCFFHTWGSCAAFSMTWTHPLLCDGWANCEVYNRIFGMKWFRRSSSPWSKLPTQPFSLQTRNIEVNAFIPYTNFRTFVIFRDPTPDPFLKYVLIPKELMKLPNVAIG